MVALVVMSRTSLSWNYPTSEPYRGIVGLEDLFLEVKEMVNNLSLSAVLFNTVSYAERLAIMVMLALSIQSMGVSAAKTQDAGMLTNFTGQVSVKPVKEQVFQPAVLMMILRPGDVINTAAGAQATIVFFADGHQEKMGAKSKAVVQKAVCRMSFGTKQVLKAPNRKDQGQLLHNAQSAYDTRLGGVVIKNAQSAYDTRLGGVVLKSVPGTDDPVEPHTGQLGYDFVINGLDDRVGVPRTEHDLMPSNTFVSDYRPIFSWSGTEAEGAKYTVMLYDDQSVLLWQQEAAATGLLYPNTQPSLLPGKAYSLEILAQSGDKTLWSEKSLFRTLPTAEYESLVQSVGELDQMTKIAQDDSTGQLLLASLYMKHGLRGNAIETFQTLVKIHPNEPKLQTALKYLYTLTHQWDKAGKLGIQH